jgi:hypothetical protein
VAGVAIWSSYLYYSYLSWSTGGQRYRQVNEVRHPQPRAVGYACDLELCSFFCRARHCSVQLICAAPGSSNVQDKRGGQPDWSNSHY